MNFSWRPRAKSTPNCGIEERVAAKPSRLFLCDQCYSSGSMAKIRPLPAPSNEPASDNEALPISVRAMPRRHTNYLDALNPEQREALDTLHGPVLVLAG